MNTREPLAPAPEVQYLPTLFRRIEKGDIRLPAFQRAFVWREAQILQLLESVYHGYPIGSVLFWKVEEPQMKLRRDSLPFPHVEERYPTSFILDGMQRLSTLYGVFHWAHPDEPNRFNVLYDLTNQRFQHYDPSELPEVYIRLSALFSPKRLIEAQKFLSEQLDSDRLIDESLKLQATFQEYLVPTVTIQRRAVRDVVEIFERVNNTGTPLSAVDFMRALTWSQDFDLNQELAGLQEGLAAEKFPQSLDTLVKVLAVVMKIDPTPDAMLSMREASAQALTMAVTTTGAVLQRVIRFLREEFKIASSQFLPYQGQLLMLVRLFCESPEPTPSVRAAARRWFWSVSFSEALRGKPDYYVVRTVNDAFRLAHGELAALERRLTVTADDFLERRFISGRALSAAFASLLAVNEARSLITGEVIESEFYMDEFSIESFIPLIGLSELKEAIGSVHQSTRIFANVVVFAEIDRKQLQHHFSLEVLEYFYETFGKEAFAILESQMLPRNSRTLFRANRLREFLRARANLLLGRARSLSTE